MFTTLNEAALAIEKLRSDILFEENPACNVDTICPFAAHHLLLGLAQLKAAQQSIHLAQLHETRALAKGD